MVYDPTMEKYRGVINMILWSAAAAFAVWRIGPSAVFILGAIEGLMVLIVAFVAHRTLDLLFPSKQPSVDE